MGGNRHFAAKSGK